MFLDRHILLNICRSKIFSTQVLKGLPYGYTWSKTRNELTVNVFDIINDNNMRSRIYDTGAGKQAKY